MLLRVSLGWLLVIWGADKVFNVEHSVAVANKYYLGLGTESILQLGGVVQILVGLLIVVGFARPLGIPHTGAIQRRIPSGRDEISHRSMGLDFWGSNALFYPSLIIFAGSLLLVAFRDEDYLSLDKKENLDNIL